MSSSRTPKKVGSEIYLLRHAHSTANLRGILAGRDNSVDLSERGFKEAQATTEYLMSHEFDVIAISEIFRCRQTAAALVASSKAEVIYSNQIVEMDYGSWSGLQLKALAKEPLWKEIQKTPSRVRFPGGESFLEMSARANGFVTELSKKYKKVLIVSHGDVLKAIIAHHLGTPLDLFQRIVIDPASISVIKTEPALLVSLNSTSHLPQAKIGKRDKFHLGGGSGRS